MTGQQSAPTEAGASTTSIRRGGTLNVGCESSVGPETTTVPPAAIATVWADAQLVRLLPAGASVPEYGTTEWASLPHTDRRRAAAVIVAAEEWRLEHRPDLTPDEWLREITADANAYAATLGDALARRATADELRARRARQHRTPPHTLRATPGWPPVRIPGGRGRYLTAQGAAV